MKKKILSLGIVLMLSFAFSSVAFAESAYQNERLAFTQEDLELQKSLPVGYNALRSINVLIDRVYDDYIEIKEDLKVSWLDASVANKYLEVIITNTGDSEINAMFLDGDPLFGSNNLIPAVKVPGYSTRTVIIPNTALKVTNQTNNYVYAEGLLYFNNLNVEPISCHLQVTFHQ